MSRPSRIVLLMFAITVTLSQLCQAAPLDAVPDTASAVVRFKRPQATVKKGLKIAARIDPEFEAQLTEMSKMIGLLISNPEVAGVDEKGDWYLAIFSLENSEPGIVFGVPAKDAAKIKSSVKGRIQFFEHEKYLFYTDNSSAAEQMKDQAEGSGPSILTAMDRTAQAVQNRNDVSVFINVKQLVSQYETELDIALEEIDNALEDMKSFAPEVPDVDMEPVFRMYGDAARMMIQAVRDTEGFAAGVTLSFKGATIEEYIHLTKGSATEKLLQSQQTTELKEIFQLPADQLAYFGFRGDFTKLYEWSMKFSTAMMKNDEDKQEFETLLKDYAAVKMSGYVGSFALGDLTQGLIRASVVTFAEPMGKVKEFTRKSMKRSMEMAMGAAPGVEVQVDFQEDAEQYGRHQADKISVTFEVGDAADPLGIQKKMMEAMYGPDGMTQRVVYLSDRFVQTIGGGKVEMEELMAAQEIIVSSNEIKKSPLFSTREQLEDKANILFFIDATGLVSEVVDLVSQMEDLPIPIDLSGLGELDIKQSYLGVSIGVSSGGVISKTHIPIEQISGIRKLVNFFMSLETPQPEF